MRYRILGHLGAALIGGGLGWFFGGHGRDPAAVTQETLLAVTEPSPSEPPAPAVVPEEREAPAADWNPSDRAVALSWAQRRWVQLNVDMFAWNGTSITPEFAALLEMSPAEAERIGQVVSEAREAVQQMELAEATAGFSPDGTQWVIDVPPFADKAATVFDRVHETLVDVLGPERHALVASLFEHQLEQKLEHLGARHRTVTFQWPPPRDESAGGRIIYHYADRSVVDGTPATGHSQQYASGLRESLGPLAELVPKED